MAATVMPSRSDTTTTTNSAASAATTATTSTRIPHHPRLSLSSGNQSTSTLQSSRADSAHHKHTYSSTSNSTSLNSRPSSFHTAPRNAAAPTSPVLRKPHKPIRSQYPATSTEKHVEYILVASFDIDRGSVLEHQYPTPVGGDEHMLAELMLPDQTHLRAQDWTIFFLHKDANEEELARRKRRRLRRRRRTKLGGAGEQTDSEGEIADEDDEDEGWIGDEDEEDDWNSDEDEDEPDNLDGPPLVYVLNLVNMKKDNTVKRGAVVKAMAICTRHSFLHIYKPLLLLALEQYFANPVVSTLASLYDAVNSMDLSLLPRFSLYERFILQSTDIKDLFIEKFEAIVAQRMAGKANGSASSPTHHPSSRNRYGLPRDTHEFESVVKYANVPVPIKIPAALSPETVGDFSLIKLITTFSTPHTTAPQPFTTTHSHLTTSGPTTHPMIVLLNALLTQKRVIFLGHNLPSSDVAEAVLAACALASGGMLRGFTRHAFPYTDLTKIDDLLRVPGFIAGVTNPAFAHKSEWWDLLCDMSTGRMKISANLERAPVTEGVVFFQQGGSNASGNQAPSAMSAFAAAGASFSAGLTMPTTGAPVGIDATGDTAFMQSVLKAIEERHGENAVRSKFRRWILRFTRLAAAFEETVYGASALQVQTSPKTPSTPFAGAEDPQSPGSTAYEAADLLSPEATGHGYVWPSQHMKHAELASYATRIEGWRSTRSYYNFIQDLAAYFPHQPVTSVDLQHLHDKLSKLRLSQEQSANIYLAICATMEGDRQISQLLAVIVNGAGWSEQGGLFYLGLALFHPKREVREGVAECLGRIRDHEAGRHFWDRLNGFQKRAWEKVWNGMEAREEG